MKRFSITVITVFSFLSAYAFARHDSVGNIAEQILNDSIGEIWISNQQYTKGDTIHLWYGYIVCPYEHAWGAFIDYYPLRNWSHKCTYLFVDVNNVEYQQFDKDLPPLHLSTDWTKYWSSATEPTIMLYDSVTVSQYQTTTSRTSILTRTSSFTEPDIPNENPHLYAIIINYCGHYESAHPNNRLWNDCAAVFTTLRAQGYPQQNIYVSSCDESEYIDFNGDGIADVLYPPTQDGVTQLFSDISHNIQENDILFVYLTGHGSFVQDFTSTYGGFLRDGFMVDYNLIAELGNLTPGVFNIVVQRNANYYLTQRLCNDLSFSTNFNIVCSFDQDYYENNDNLSIDNYTERFVSAVSPYNMVGDINLDGYISMQEAHTYAFNANNSSGYQNSSPFCLKNELSITSLRPDNSCIQTDLYIRDNNEDYGNEPNITTTYAYISPDLWIEDLNGNRVDRCISGELYNVCVRISNRGNMASSGDERLHLHWCKAVIGGKWPDSWHNNSYDCNGSQVQVGGKITEEEGDIIPVIPAYGNIVVRIPWTTPDNNEYMVCSEFIDSQELWHYCLLARIYDEHEQPGSDMTYQPLGSFVLNSNNVVSKNITIMSRTNENNMKGVVGISAPHSGLFTLEGRIYTTQPDNMQLYLYMDTNLYDNWSGTGEGISDEGYRVQVESYYTTFDNVYLDEDVLYTIMIELEDFEASDFVYNITLVDGNGERYGGESFQMPSDSTNIARVHARRVLEDNTASKGESPLSTCIPLEDIFSANSAFNIRQITIFDMAGKEVLRSFCNLSKTDMSNLAKGAYYVVVNTNEATYTCKIIK